MNQKNTDRIEKGIELKASLSRVWRALTDHVEFGQWFKVNLEGPFLPGQPNQGPITYPGYEHLTLKLVVEKMEPERLFSFRWQPQAINPDKDYSGEPSTLVEFKLEKIAGGTLLTLVESGFDALPAGVRAESFHRNEGGWSEQMTHIQVHLDQAG